MSRISSVFSAAKDRGTRKLLRRLEAWLDEHPDQTLIDPREVLRAWGDVSPTSLAEAFRFLVDQEVLRRVYKVESPQGVLVGGDYLSPRDVPDEVPDSFDRYFDTHDADVVQVFRAVGTASE